MENILKLVEANLSVLKIFFISIFTIYTMKRVINQSDKNQWIYKLSIAIFVIIISYIYSIIKNSKDNFYSTNFYSMTFLITMLSIIGSKIYKKDIIYSLLITIISFSINYAIFFCSVSFAVIINKIILSINNKIIEFVVILTIYAIFINLALKTRKIKNGLIFLQTKFKDEFVNLIILNLSMIITLSVIVFPNYKGELASNLVLAFVIFCFIMFTTIQKSLQLYYKQKLLDKELEETKLELAKKEKEVEDLEAENISISKKSHTLAHKQKALEYKLEEIINKTEISKEEVGEVSDRIKALEKDLYKEKTTIELDQTEITQIDDMLKYMQSECKKNNIDFELQVKGNIHYMTNNLITKDDLETLLADHIKNAIIAINHTDNINRSILVRLGEIDGIYSLYIYDSGIEFKKETLENLGKKPSTTHKDEGGTGMGFMNTFDTLRKCNASLIIEEINKPSKDNYTKVIIIKFDKKNEFNIISYRQQKVN